MGKNPVKLFRQSRGLSQRKATIEARIHRDALRNVEADKPVTWPVITALALWMNKDAKQLEAELAARRQKETA